MQQFQSFGGVLALVLAAGSATGQDTFSGTDFGQSFTFFGISSSGAAGISEGQIGAQSDAFDSVFNVRVNGVQLAATSFFDLGELKTFTNTVGTSQFASYTLAFRPDRAIVRLDIKLANNSEVPTMFNVEVDHNYGSDASTTTQGTSSGDLVVDTFDRWIVTDDTSTSVGDPAIGFTFGGPSGSVTPTSISVSPPGFVEVVHDVQIEPFEPRTLSYFLEIDTQTGFALADIADFNTRASIRDADFFGENFVGASGLELNFDTYERWDGSASDSLLDAANWEFDSVPTFDPARIRNDGSVFLPEGARLSVAGLELENADVEVRPGSTLSSDARFLIDDDSTIRIDSATLNPSDPIINEGTIFVESLGAEIGDITGGFPSIRNKGTVEITGTPFTAGFASLEIPDDTVNLGQWILRGAARFDVEDLDNRGNLDVVFANAILDGRISNGVEGLVTVSGGSQFNQVGNLTNDGTVVVSSDSSYSLLGRLQGNGIEGPGGPGTAGTVFIRDGVTGRSGGTNRIGFDGQLSLGSAATTTVRLGGTSVGSGFDQLDVAGTLNAAGTLRIESFGGFVPQPGDSFEVLGFDSVQGSFSSIEFDSTLAGVGFDTSTLLIDGTLRVPAACPADVNGDGNLTPADFTSWILAFNARSGACDQNGDGLCTPQDFTSWILNFNAGCGE
ncbi:MAG: GC-type dockerin domain-anchored protein [Planctomycetota bacterium]